MSKENVSIAMCQLNLTTGDFEGNYALAREAVSNNKADIYVFQECTVSNYAADDMLLDEGFIQASAKSVDRFVALSGEFDTTLIFGAPYGGRCRSKRVANMLLVADRGKLVWQHEKSKMPNYDVFDDVRLFEKGKGARGNLGPFLWSRDDRSLKIGTAVCEEIWEQAEFNPGLDIEIVINSSPFAIGKAKRRRDIVLHRVTQTGVPVFYVNQVGGNDELVFDGGSCAADPSGGFYEMPQWQEGVAVIEVKRADGDNHWKLASTQRVIEEHPLAERYIAACIGLRDYFKKVGIWKSVVLGLSGGADSALVLMMAADVLGWDKVRPITMPSGYTSDLSNSLAFRLASGVGGGIQAHTLPIKGVYAAFREEIDAELPDIPEGLADENLQAQLRGDFLSFYSNAFGSLLLSTGNKSEIACGFATIYGDMRGGFNPLGDLYKTEVFKLIEMRWQHALKNDALLESTFKTAFGHGLEPMTEDAAAALRETGERPPSAELREGQLDSQSLPDYSTLDPILQAMIDNRDSWTNERIAAETNNTIELVNRVRGLLRRSEYKRWQSAPKPKIHMKSFTRKDWRFPMVNKFLG